MDYPGFYIARNKHAFGGEDQRFGFGRSFVWIIFIHAVDPMADPLYLE